MENSPLLRRYQRALWAWLLCWTAGGAGLGVALVAPILGAWPLGIAGAVWWVVCVRLAEIPRARWIRRLAEWTVAREDAAARQTVRALAAEEPETPE